MKYKFTDEMFPVSTEAPNMTDRKATISISVQKVKDPLPKKRNNIRLKLTTFRVLRPKLKK